MDNKKLVEKGGQYFKYIAGILFLACVGSLFSLKILRYEESSFNSFLGIWLILLHVNLWDTKPISCPQHKETAWDARLRHTGKLCTLVFEGFFFAFVLIFLLSLLLQWTLEINILELDTLNSLLFFVWGGGIIALHLYNKYQNERELQRQLGMLSRGEMVDYPRPELTERWEEEKQLAEYIKKRRKTEQNFDRW